MPGLAQDGETEAGRVSKINFQNIMKKNWFYLLFTLATLSATSMGTAASVLYPVVVDGRWGFVNKSGETVINPQFERVGGFAEGLAPVRLSRWGYVDSSGKITIVPQFDKADVFNEGLAAIKVGGGGGGSPFPNDPRPFAHGGGGGYGYINTDGKFAINPQFEDAGMFSDGLGPVRTGGRWGYVDKTGTVVP